MTQIYAEVDKIFYEIEICEKCSQLKIKKRESYRKFNPTNIIEKEFYISFETAKKFWDICEKH